MGCICAINQSLGIEKNGQSFTAHSSFEVLIFLSLTWHSLCSLLSDLDESWESQRWQGWQGHTVSVLFSSSNPSPVRCYTFSFTRARKNHGTWQHKAWAPFLSLHSSASHAPLSMCSALSGAQASWSKATRHKSHSSLSQTSLETSEEGEIKRVIYNPSKDLSFL